MKFNSTPSKSKQLSTTKQNSRNPQSTKKSTPKSRPNSTATSRANPRTNIKSTSKPTPNSVKFTNRATRATVNAKPSNFNPGSKLQSTYEQMDKRTNEVMDNTSDLANTRYQDLFKPPGDVALGQTYRSPVVTLEITEDDHNRRIDNFLISILPNIPKSTFYRLLRKGEIRVNKGRIKPEYKLQNGDLVRVCPLELVHKEDKVLNLDSVVKLNSVKSLADNIVYEDKDLIIINKPAGIAVHGGSGLSFGVIEAVRHLFPLEKRLELVHRIDRDTSGLLMIAKKPSILKNLQDQFRYKTIYKSYYCLVPGKWTAKTVDAPLNYYLNGGEKFVEVSSKGKPSVTDFKVVQYYRDEQDNIFSLVEASPRTGRTHQIRVHCLHALAALVGDSKYSSLAEQNYYKKHNFNRMFLHAFKLNYIDPKTEERKIIEIPLDPELQKIIDKLTPVYLKS